MADDKFAPLFAAEDELFPRFKYSMNRPDSTIWFGLTQDDLFPTEFREDKSISHQAAEQQARSRKEDFHICTIGTAPFILFSSFTSTELRYYPLTFRNQTDLPETISEFNLKNEEELLKLFLFILRAFLVQIFLFREVLSDTKNS